MKKLSKTKKLIIVICFLLLLIIILLSGLHAYNDYKNKKIYEEMSIQFVKNKIIEYGDKNATSKQLVESSNGKIIKYPDLNVMEVGKHDLVYQLE